MESQTHSPQLQRSAPLHSPRRRQPHDRRPLGVKGLAVVAICATQLLAACADGDTSTSTAASDSNTSSTAAPSTTGAPAGADSANTSTTEPATGADKDTQAPAELAAWQTIELTDSSGASFAFADLLGTPVFVENFATWCSNCKKQLVDTQKAAKAAGENAVFVALSVETELDASDLADYAEENGFKNIRFVVMSPEMLGAIDDAFGKSSLNPPATPKFVIDATGTPDKLETGFESPQEIADRLAEVG